MQPQITIKHGQYNIRYVFFGKCRVATINWNSSGDKKPGEEYEIRCSLPTIKKKILRPEEAINETLEAIAETFMKNFLYIEEEEEEEEKPKLRRRK